MRGRGLVVVVVVPSPRVLSLMMLVLVIAASILVMFIIRHCTNSKPRFLTLMIAAHWVNRLSRPNAFLIHSEQVPWHADNVFGFVEPKL